MVWKLLEWGTLRGTVPLAGYRQRVGTRVAQPE
jgi:hypothetical protein